jgi:Concanavalin A-like lectin/glucanases superfamily
VIKGFTRHRVTNVPSIVLMHFDGTNGSTTFTDVYGHNFTRVGGAILSTANPKWGTAALRLSGNQTDGIHAPPTGTEFDLQGDWTMEGWVFYNNILNAQALCSRDDGSGSTNKWGCGLNILTANNFSLHRNYLGTAHNVEFPWAPSLSTYYHVCLQHDHNAGKTWFCANGVMQSQVSDTFNLPIPTTDLNLAIGYLEEGAWFSNADIDDFRLSNVVRYPLGNFTPPSGPFTF